MTTTHLSRRYSFDERNEYNELRKRQEKEKLFNNSWNSTQENLLRIRGEQAFGYKWMHDRSRKNIEWYSNVIGIFGIIFGTISGTGAFINTIVNSDVVEIVVGTSAYIGTISTILLKYLTLETTAMEHKRSADRFHALGSEIKNQLAMFRHERKSGNEYMEATRLQFDRLIAEAPIIDTDISEEFTQKFGKTNIAKPDIADGIDAIAIRTKSASFIQSPPATRPVEETVIEVSKPTKKNSAKENTRMALQEEFERQLRQREKDEINKNIAYQLSRLKS